MTERRDPDETLASAEETPPRTATDDAAGEGGLGGSARYQIVGEVGRGGLGLILRATDRTLGRPVALKVMAGGASARRRFEDEARITARLEHPSIVPVYDAGQLGEVPFYAMKLSGGRTLGSAIRDAPDLAARLELLGAVLAVADAIAFAHSRGVIHRDLKPDNVLVGEFGETLVIDWGLAKEIGGGDPAAPGPDGEGADEAIRTRAGDVLGTPAFMAPEQARGEPLDFRADVFAIGAILYTVLAGRAPRRGRTQEVVAAARADAIEPVERHVPDVPRDLAAICARALSLDRDARYPSARELAEDLRRFQTGQLVAARDYSLAQRFGRWIRRHRALVAMAAASIAALAVIGTIALARVVAARRRAEAESARLVLAQARTALDRDPATALAWLARLLDGPAVDAVELEDLRVLAADARARGAARFALPGAVSMVALDGTPDGRFVVGRDVQGGLVVWDVAAGTTRATLAGPFRDVALAPDGATIATADHDGVTLRGLDGRAIGAVAAHVPIASLGYTSDGRVILVGTDGVLRILSGPTLAQDAPITLARGLAGGRVAFAGATFVGWWDPATGATARAPLGSEPFRLTASHDGRRVGVWASDRTTLFAIEADRIVEVERGDMGSIAFRDDGAIAWGSRAGIELRDPRTGHAITLTSPANAFVTFAGPRLAASNDRTKLFVFAELPVEPVRAWKRDAAIRYVRTADGERTAYLSTAGEVGFVDAATGAATPIATDARFYVGTTVVLAAIGDRLVVGGDALRTIDARTGRVTTIGPAGAACVVALPSGDVAVLTLTGELRVYDPTLTTLRRERRVEPGVRECVARPDGTIAASFDQGVVALIDPATGAGLARDRSPSGASADTLASLPDGTVLIGDFHGDVRAWTPGWPSRVLLRHEGPVWGVAASPDGRLIASCGRDRSVRVSTVDGHVVEIFRGHHDEVSNVAFGRDGRTLTSASMDGTILRWPVDPSRAPPSTAAGLAAHVAALTTITIDDAR